MACSLQKDYSSAMPVINFYAYIALGCSRTPEGLAFAVLFKLVSLSFFGRLRNPSEQNISFVCTWEKNTKFQNMSLVSYPFFEKIIFLISRDHFNF